MGRGGGDNALALRRSYDGYVDGGWDVLADLLIVKLFEAG